MALSHTLVQNAATSLPAGTATAVPASVSSNRVFLKVFVIDPLVDGAQLYTGGSTLTAANGTPVPYGEQNLRATDAPVFWLSTVATTARSTEETQP